MATKKTTKKKVTRRGKTKRYNLNYTKIKAAGRKKK